MPRARDDARHDQRPQHRRGRPSHRARAGDVPLRRSDDPFPGGRRAAARARLEPDRGRPPRPAAVPPLRLRARRLPARAPPGACAGAPAVPDGAAADRLARRADDAALRDLGGPQRRPPAGGERARLPSRGRGRAGPARDARGAPRNRAGARRPHRAHRRLGRSRRARHRDDVDAGAGRDAGGVSRRGRRRAGAGARRARLDDEARARRGRALRQRLSRVGHAAAGHDPRPGRDALRPRRRRRGAAAPRDRRPLLAARATARRARPLGRRRTHRASRRRPPPRCARVRGRAPAPLPCDRAPSRRLAGRARRDRARLLRRAEARAQPARARLHRHLLRGERRRRDDAPPRRRRGRRQLRRLGRRRLARAGAARGRDTAAGLVAAAAVLRVDRP